MIHQNDRRISEATANLMLAASIQHTTKNSMNNREFRIQPPVPRRKAALLWAATCAISAVAMGVMLSFA